ncbi:hypothetical protein FDECE_3897 [Fusarium decemcellulare]|nr:hypothetical protein FDECE_3897 [Fusarium decemcellulare]
MRGANSRAGPKHEAQPGFKESTVPAARFWALSVGVCLGLFLSIIDTSIIATSLYSIGVEFQDVRRVNWVALAYTLSYLGCAVTFARVSDVVGRRNAFVAAYVVFFAFSLACGFAQSLGQLIACRTLQGIGGSGLYSLPMIILPELCPEHLRQHIASIIGLVIAGSGALGPVLGGALTHYATWRWVFWINGPISFISLIIFFLSWPKAEHLPSTTKRSWKEFDYIGSFLIIAAAVLVVFPFQNAGESPGATWGTAVFIAPLIIGLVLWLVLLAWGYLARRIFEDRLALTFPINLFRNRAYTAAAISTLFLGYPYFMITYAFPLRAQVVDDKSPMMAGIMLLPMLGATAVGSILAGVLSKTKNYLFETMLAGACLMTLGTGLLTIVHSAGDDAKALTFIVFAGLGFGLNVASATMLTAVEVPIRDYGKFHRQPPKSSRYLKLIKRSTRAGYYSTVENPRRQPGYLDFDRFLKHKSQRTALGSSDATRTGHTRSMRGAAFAGSTQCSASSLLGSLPQRHGGCGGGIRGGCLGGPRCISSRADACDGSEEGTAFGGDSA